MGGAKKKSPAQQEKSQKDEKEKKSGTKKKGKKKDKEGESKKEITVLVDEAQAMKYIQSAKVITVHDLSRQNGVKISAANAFLRKLLQKGEVKRVGGYSGHHIYQPVSG